MKRFVLLGFLVMGSIAVACSDDPVSENGNNSTEDGGKGDSTIDKDSGPEEQLDSAVEDTSTPLGDAKTDAPNVASDAGPDGGGGGNAKACAAYCACMDAIDPCKAAFKNEKDCNTKCTAQTNWDLACRGTHCGLATAAKTKGDRTTHCGHAEGVGLCLNK